MLSRAGQKQRRLHEGGVGPRMLSPVGFMAGNLGHTLFACQLLTHSGLELLREAGHEVEWTGERETDPGDQEILRYANNLACWSLASLWVGIHSD